MKKLLLTVSGIFAAGTVFAGSLLSGEGDSQIIEPVEQARNSGWIIPLLIVGVVIAFAIASNDSNSNDNGYGG